MNQPNKLECYITLGWKGLPMANTLTYCYNSQCLKKMEGCEFIVRERIHNTSISSLPTNASPKLECLLLEGLCLVKCNTLAYLDNLKVKKKIKCCEYGPRCHLQLISSLTPLGNELLKRILSWAPT